MNNDPELNGKFLGTITEDFVKVADFLKESSYQIRKRGFSDHPIFVVSNKEISIGLPLVKKDEKENKWFYNAALPEHMMEKNLILEESIEEFINIYKDPEEYCCLFVVLEGFTNFIFLPYPEDMGEIELL